MKAKLDDYYWAQGHLAIGACLSPKKAKHMTLLAPKTRRLGGSGTGTPHTGRSRCWQRQHTHDVGTGCSCQWEASRKGFPSVCVTKSQSRQQALDTAHYCPFLETQKSPVLDSREPRAEHTSRLLLPSHLATGALLVLHVCVCSPEPEPVPPTAWGRSTPSPARQSQGQA